MAVETVYIIQTYVQGRGKALKAEQQQGCSFTDEPAERGWSQSEQ